MVPTAIMLALLAVATVLPIVQPFTIPCVGCTCFDKGSDHVIDCSGRNLTSVPDGVRNQGNVYEIILSGNTLTHMKYLDFVGTTAVKVDLSDNKIHTIDDSTFNGSPNIESLDLHENELSSLPEVLTHLVKINTLDVRDNPQSGFNPINLINNIMKEMGDTIQKFQFGHRELDHWPETISHFQDLQDLTLDKSSDQLKVIPPMAFHSFQSTLLILTIKNTKLVAVPLGVSTLRRIKEFHFDNNILVGDEGIVAQAFVRAHTTLETLSLINDHLTSFPRALAYIPSLRNLDMSNNSLQFISDESILNLGINSLVMQNCNLDRIPGALFHLKYLTQLDMSYNKLVTVENNDIQNIPGVANLTLSHNPIKFISNTAFGDHKGLNSVDISYTDLTTIPQAFNTTDVFNINLIGSHIDCMCEYVWVSMVNKFEGCCANIEEHIDDYVKLYVPLCPEHIEKNGLDPLAETALKNHIKTPDNSECQSHN
uniref:Leucine-rich repeat protein 5 n=1 Tax=Azumapecten farreri TaxID=106299 RepID=A0A077BAI5_AZUFA|nr:leucine-rich repeat protein 5 [Azumapecten farreri]